MKAFTFFVLFLWVESTWAICDTVADIDKKCGSEVIYFGKRDLIIPFDAEHFKQICGNYEEGINCLDRYVESCTMGQTKALGNMMLAPHKAHMAARCHNPSFRGDFISHNQCFRNATVLEEFHVCADVWIHRMAQLVKPEFDPNLHIMASCCIFDEFTKCIVDRDINLCHDKKKDYWVNALQDLFGLTVDNFCVDAKTTDECNANFPRDVWKTIIDPVAAMTPEQLKTRPRFQSSFFTLLDMSSGFKLYQ